MMNREKALRYLLEDVLRNIKLASLYAEEHTGMEKPCLEKAETYAGLIRYLVGKWDAQLPAQHKDTIASLLACANARLLK